MSLPVICITHLSAGFFNLPVFSITHFSNAFSAIIKLCSDKGHTFEPNVVHIDFEERVMIVMKQFFPSITVKCCRFHLGQAWWRKIKKVGLSSEYKEAESEIGKWMKGLFGIQM